MQVRPLEESERAWAADVLVAHWGSVRVVSRGRLTEDASRLPGLVAERDGRPLGIALLRFERGEGEVVVLQSLEERQGAGTALLEAARAEAKRAGCRRLWLVTANDNVEAIRFYQCRGWDLVALHRDALRESRRLKPEISEIGAHGIPIRHELEFEAPKS
jgi:GNAT superfamily N-acetyltransferase